MNLKILIQDRPTDLEEAVNSFLQGKKVISSNFQRNVFYPRSIGSFKDELEETFTAFLLWDSL